MQADVNENEEHLMCVICEFVDILMSVSKNVIQHYWKLVLERLYHIEPWLGGCMYFTVRGSEDFHQFHTVIIAVEQSVRK